MPGFSVTAATRALYKYNESSVPGTGYATAVDAAAFGGTARNLTETNAAVSGLSRNYTHIVNGDGRSDCGYARWFPGSGLNACLARTGDATFTSNLLASWSWEAFVCPNQQSQNVWSYIGASSTNSAENCLGQVYFDTTGYINMYWETGSGTTVSSASAAGAITFGVWQHVAVTMDWSGATVTVKFYVNGSLITTVTGKTKATGGGNSDIYIGKDSHGNANYWGAMKSVRVSKKLRDASEVAASAALLSTTCEHTTDGDTLAHWKLAEAPDAHEQTEYGYHLRKVGGSITVVDPLVSDSGHARHMDASTEYDAHWGYEPFRAMLAGDWTYQAWVQFDSGYASAQRGQWVYGDPGSDTSVVNFTSLDLNSNRKLQLFMEHGAGLDSINEMSVVLFAAVADGYNKHLITVSKRNTTGTNHELKFYLDDTLVDTIVATQGYDGGEQSYLRISSGASGGSAAMLGRVDDQIWNAEVITQDELDDIFVETSSGGSPVIELVSPAEGAIALDDDIVIDFTDVDDDLVGILIFVQLVNADIHEMVYHGHPTVTPAFYGAYLAASTIEDIADGKRVTITRDGGWVDSDIVVKAWAVDALGNSDAEEFAFTTAFDGVYACAVGGERPVVTIISPLPVDDPEEPISATDPLVFTVTDPDAEPGLGGGLKRVVPILVFPDALRSKGAQLIHDGDDFYPMFTGSTREAIEGGYQYTVVWWNEGRWPSRPRLLPFAYDLTGLEAL